MAWTFDPIRRSLIEKGHSRAAIDNLELALNQLQAEIDTVPTYASEAWVTARIAEAVREAVAKAHLLDFVPFTRDEIIAIVDNTILAETGDDILDESGDALLMESA